MSNDKTQEKKTETKSEWISLPCSTCSDDKSLSESWDLQHTTAIPLFTIVQLIIIHQYSCTNIWICIKAKPHNQLNQQSNTAVKLMYYAK